MIWQKFKETANIIKVVNILVIGVKIRDVDKDLIKQMEIIIKVNGKMIS
jgi:hypothetical protein